MTLKTGEAGTRRRGAELEEALLRAAWDELVEVGYGAVTMEGVAARAGTSRAVLYRRWASRPELIAAASRHHGRGGPPRVPNTGELRGDMLAIMRYMADRCGELAGLTSFLVAEFFEQAGGAGHDLRKRVFAPELAVLDAVLAAAEERGELGPGVRHGRIGMLAVDLLRNEVLMTGEVPPEAVIVDILDTVFLPLAKAGVPFG